MCGIVGYVGPRQAQDILMHGLARLEYRGYDSAGLAVASRGKVGITKAEGKLARLIGRVDRSPLTGNAGIGHTRWATHGVPSDRNAHPHCDETGEFAIVHNGIVENFQVLRDRLEAGGVAFRSDTDSEVLAHLVALAYDGDLTEAVRRAIRQAEGAYALVAMTSRQPDRIVAARMISPLVVGLGEGENFLASDIPAVLEHTREFLLVEDGEIATVTSEGATLETIAGSPVRKQPFTAEWETDSVRKGGFDHFMLKEIHEQPDVIARTLGARIRPGGDGGEQVALEGLEWSDRDPAAVDRIWITACGTAYHAGLVGRVLFEQLAGIPGEVAFAHELRYGRPLFRDGSLTLAISQSGETADTVAAARLARHHGSRLLALTNVVGSSLAREADDVLYTWAGPEISVASTKAYVAMLVGESLLALALGRRRGLLSRTEERDLVAELRTLPDKATCVLEDIDRVARLADVLAGSTDAYFIGRGLDLASAMEGALKLKEISYIHAEAMPAGELKHGTLALISEGTPVVAVVTQEDVHSKAMLGLQEVKARRGLVIAVAYEDDEEIGTVADHVLRIPRVADIFSPILAAIPLQLLAYFVARRLGRDIDQPRNLAKSVTVE
ncbi:glutamine--fructose-6-phosphate transaminase (isomerizing) [Candidatus Spongiisocius sp.]|uniref:glutamine--fructose-6-phosphate transaminase (isomerizing) n=1 Tax=Candidatus Spongiisocius sp. TaxID=3101273 RepID=UPI003B58DB41